MRDEHAGCGMRQRRQSRAAAVSAALLLAALSPGLTAPALAHTELISSDPPPGSQLDSPPERLVLTFGADLASSFSSLAIRVDNGEATPVDARVEGPRLIAETTAAASSVAADGDPATWAALYRVVTADGHPISGEVTFSVVRASEGSLPPTEVPAAGPPPSPVPAAGATTPTPAIAVGADVDRLPWGPVTGLGALTVGLVSWVLLAARTRRRSSAEG